MLSLLVAAVHPGDVLGHLARARDDGAEVTAEDGPQVVEGEDVRRVGKRDEGHVAPEADGEQLVPARHGLG